MCIFVFNYNYNILIYYYNTISYSLIFQSCLNMYSIIKIKIKDKYSKIDISIFIRNIYFEIEIEIL